MNRSGYTDDYDIQLTNLYRGAVERAIRGKRGQEFLTDLVAALDAIPEKRLISSDLQNDEGVCAIGSVGVRRGIGMDDLDPCDADTIAMRFGIAQALVREIEYVNDDFWASETPEQRWQRVREWAVQHIKADHAS